MSERRHSDQVVDGGPYPRPFWRAVSSGFGGAVVGFDVIGTFVVLGMMIVVNLDVLGRWLFNAPLAGTAELSEIGIVALVYLHIAHTIRSRSLIRADTLLNYLERKSKILTEQSLRCAFNLAGAVVFAIIAYGQAPRLIASWNGGYYKGNEGVFTVPVWPLDTIILVGSILASMQFLALAWANISNIRTSGPGANEA